MKQPNIAKAGVVLAGAAFAALAGPGAQANAVTIEFPQVPTLAYGGWCGTTIRTWADVGPAWPGRAILNMRALPVAGIGPGDYPLAPLCEVRTTVAWHNTSTGAVGGYDETIVAGLYGSMQYSLLQDTGPGLVEVTVTTDHANIPARGSFQVPAPAAPTA
ncbi:hypothetical protein [Nocardia sp. CS682]|uniref:hypothetical protein n=1 Tax=Nocardia sp. CS682 TaxID=1047172 RepID=UPI001074AC65|nr:hypothetical protein [Nocardia sp. CS682]QBS41256.1 hypothetical protein DMB37_15150 [Nocardia sp. CS682]